MYLTQKTDHFQDFSVLY